MKIKYKRKGILWLVGVLLIGVIVLAHKQKSARLSVTQNSPTPTSSQQYPVDAVNDSVYTNYKYGFKFEYPKEIFKVKPSNTMPDNNGTLKREWLSDYSNNLILNVEIMQEKISKIYYPEYKTLLTLKPGQSIGSPDASYSQKISEPENTNANLVFYYNETDNSTETKLVTYSYRVIWKINDQLIIFSLISDSKTVLQKNKYIFDNIIKTLKFVNPQKTN